MTAADWIAARDPGVRIIAAQFVENAAVANNHWIQAAGAARDNPDLALTHVVECELLLETLLPIGIKDFLTLVREAGKRLDRELPDDGEEVPT